MRKESGEQKPSLALPTQKQGILASSVDASQCINESVNFGSQRKALTSTQHDSRESIKSAARGSR